MRDQIAAAKSPDGKSYRTFYVPLTPKEQDEAMRTGMYPDKTRKVVYASGVHIVEDLQGNILRRAQPHEIIGKDYRPNQKRPEVLGQKE